MIEQKISGLSKSITKGIQKVRVKALKPRASETRIRVKWSLWRKITMEVKMMMMMREHVPTGG
jgi:hypothetical protein